MNKNENDIPYFKKNFGYKSFLRKLRILTENNHETVCWNDSE